MFFQVLSDNNLPQGWEQVSLDDVCEIIMGQSPPSETYNIEGIGMPFFQGKAEFTDLYPVPKKWCTKPNKIAEKNDILLSVRAPVGNTNVADRMCCIGRGLAAIRFENSKFLFYFFRAIEKELEKKGTGTTFKAISGDVIRKINVPFPPFQEQYRIVAKIEELLSELDKGVEALKTTQHQLKIYRQAVLIWAFEGKLTEEWRKKRKELPSSKQLSEQIKTERQERLKLNGNKKISTYSLTECELNELNSIPNGWTWVKLGEITYSIKDGPHYSPPYQDKGVPFITGGNIRPDGVDFGNVKYISEQLNEELKRRCTPELGDILYSKGGTTGIARVNTYDFEFNVWVHVAVLKLIDSMVPFYVQHALNSNHCYKQSQKFTHGVGNQDLGLTRMVNITLPICSPEEQKQIVEEIESRLLVCDKLEEAIVNSLKQAEALRQSILKKAFEGKLVPQDPNDEPASVLLERIKAKKATQEIKMNNIKKASYGR